VSQVVLLTSSVGVTPAHVIQSNLWMLETAANDTNGPNGKSKILSVVGSLDTTEDPATFEQQLMELAQNQLFVGIRLGDLGSILNGTSNPFPNNLKPNVLQNLQTMATMGLQVDAIGLSGAVMAQVGQATGISIVMDHFANEGNTFRPSSAWMQDMQIAATYPGLHIKVSDVEVLSEAALGDIPLGLVSSSLLPTQLNITQ
jgi:predicted TIM-barrel fold metal-dependent hydrolase